MGDRDGHVQPVTGLSKLPNDAKLPEHGKEEKQGVTQTRLSHGQIL